MLKRSNNAVISKKILILKRHENIYIKQDVRSESSDGHFVWNLEQKQQPYKFVASMWAAKLILQATFARSSSFANRLNLGKHRIILKSQNLLVVGTKL